MGAAYAPAQGGVPHAARLAELAEVVREDMVAVRRHIHAHPEPARSEHETTALVAAHLRGAGLAPHLLPGSGLICDIGDVEPGERRTALRADLDALPVEETANVPYRSTRRGYSHACGHDAHTAIVLGAGLVLAVLAREGALGGGVRLIFQPAEEVQPGGAHDVIAAGGIEGVGRIITIHCDPKVDVGRVGSRIGPITSASDSVSVTLTSPGGHTSRPHLTGDVVFALGQVVTQVPAILGRRLDPRAGVNLTWGSVAAGTTHNAIPATGTARGTIRCLDEASTERAAEVFLAAVRHVAAPYEVEVEVDVVRGVRAVVNEETAVGILEDAARAVLGPDAVELTEQSLGGEDFGWYLARVPGAMVRLGTRTPGGPTHDLHQADFRIDERAVDAGTRLLAAAALISIRR